MAELELLDSREACEESLLEFLRQAWPWFDPSPLVINWHMEAIAEHLEAVSCGQIRRLLINIPPRTGKTSLTASHGLYGRGFRSQTRITLYSVLVCGSCARPMVPRRPSRMVSRRGGL
ncbi:MAG: hypothetical protein JO122_17565 [Acetobacteraceae bacterium]|nr:hypothetical protein [Acetobacteraceae bacterium]